MSRRIAARRLPFFYENRREPRNHIGLYWPGKVDAMIEKALLAEICLPHCANLEEFIECRNGS
jgi:hypothetical protein